MAVVCACTVYNVGVCCMALKSNKQDSRAEMDRLCKFIYTKDSTDRIRTRAILCHIYHNALHDRWYEARDLMLMSHLQDSVQHSDIPTQVHCCSQLLHLTYSLAKMTLSLRSSSPKFFTMFFQFILFRSKLMD